MISTRGTKKIQLNESEYGTIKLVIKDRDTWKQVSLFFILGHSWRVSIIIFQEERHMNRTAISAKNEKQRQ